MQKNILLITTDQQSATMMSCTGNKDLNTPNMDRLALEGVRFEMAYVAQPLCIPQRCSWYTGLMPHQHGVTFNLPQSELKSCTMMGKIFRDAGYATGYSGKWHIMVKEDNKEVHGFQWTNNLRCNRADEGIVPDFKKFLEGRKNHPFLFSASFNNPHNICEAARGSNFECDGSPGLPENMDQLPPLPDNFSIPEHEPSIIREIQARYRSSNYPTAHWDEMRWRLHRYLYARMTEIVDRRIGELLVVLKEHDLLGDTLIVFTSDHGDGNAHHQWNQKQLLYDESSRVPFIISNPGSGQRPLVSEQLVNTGIDLIPTLCGLAEIDCQNDLKGVDWSCSLKGQDPQQQRDHVVIETELGTYGTSAGVLGRAIRTPRFKYMVYNKGLHREFLVDMEKDPGEMTNLVADSSYRCELDRHRKLLMDYIEITEDIFHLEL